MATPRAPPRPCLVPARRAHTGGTEIKVCSATRTNMTSSVPNRDQGTEPEVMSWAWLKAMATWKELATW